MTEDERVDRFEAAYNRIDRGLSDLIDDRSDRRKHGFSAKVRIAASRRRRFSRFKDFLLEVGELRNALVHSRIGADEFLAVPSEKTVLELEWIEQAMFAPEKVLPRFQGNVLTLRADQTLAEAWALVRDDGYSRYPVYDRDGFIGLLTSNGFARWTANHAHGGKIEVDATTVSVREVLAADHRRDAVEFVSRDALVDDIDQLFVDRKVLEAVLITANGQRTERPLGMICAANMASRRA
jgi:predicted transcriptional regulator